MFNIIKWFRYKGWFIFDLPYFIQEKKLDTGIEIGAKAGRSMYFMLKENPNLHLTGIDFWKVIEGSAYRFNDKNEQRCRRKLKPFAGRYTLLKGDAFAIANNIPDASCNFIHYDLHCKIMTNRHQEMLAKWIPKIKKGGLLIGRDFKEFRAAFFALGFAESDFKKCTMRGRTSLRLEYLEIK